MFITLVPNLCLLEVGSAVIFNIISFRTKKNINKEQNINADQVLMSFE